MVTLSKIASTNFIQQGASHFDSIFGIESIYLTAISIICIMMEKGYDRKADRGIIQI